MTSLILSFYPSHVLKQLPQSPVLTMDTMEDFELEPRNQQALVTEDLVYSPKSALLWLQKLKARQAITRKPAAGRPRKQHRESENSERSKCRRMMR